MKPPFFICTGGSSEESTKTRNNITIYSELDSENNKIYYQAKSEYPVTSIIEITVVSTNETKTVLELNLGDTETEKEEGDSLDILRVDLNVKKDDEYDYYTIINGMEEYTIYTKAVSVKDAIKNPKEEGYSVTKIKLNNHSDIMFTIPKSEININDYNDEQFIEYTKENQYRLVLFLPKKIFIEDRYSIKNSTNGDVKNNFKNIDESSIFLDNIDYIYLCEGASVSDYETDTRYIPEYNEDKVYNYILNLIK